MTMYDRIRGLLDDYAEQRFLMTAITGMGTFILTWFDKISSETYGVVTIGTVGAFIGAAVYEKVQTMRAEKAEAQG